MTPDPNRNFWEGLARAGWLVIFAVIALVPVVIVLSFSLVQLLVGAGVALVLIPLMCAADYPTKDQQRRKR